MRASGWSTASSTRCWVLPNPASAAGRCCLRYFGDDCEPCGNCDVCLDPPETFDGSVAAQKLLSCIYRTGERFGQAHVISVLLGEPDERIERLGHDKLSTFGIGKEHDRNAWRSIVRQLVAHGLIAVDVAGHGGLSISPEGRQFLREKPPLSLRVLKKAQAGTEIRSPGGKGSVARRRPRPVREAARQAPGAGQGAERAALCHLPRQDACGNGRAPSAVRCRACRHPRRRRSQARALWGGVPGGHQRARHETWGRRSPALLPESNFETR